MKPTACSSPSGVKKWIVVVTQALRGYGFNIFLLLAVSGCSAAGVVETSDPYRKMAQAEQLWQTGRIAMARRHFLEAIEIFELRGDDLDLAEAYRIYGFFALENGEDVILRHARPDPTQIPTNEDGKVDTSIAYFQKSLAIAEANDDHGKVTNLHYNIGFNYYYIGRLDEACRSFDRSLASYRKSMKIKPDLIVDLPAGVNNFPELIDRAKQKTKCG